MPKHDVLVIGAGLAGQRAALAAAEEGVSVGIVSKVHPVRSHSNAAQGGINAALQEGRQLGVARLRHRQGLRLPRRPGRDRDHVPRGAGGDPPPRAPRRHLPPQRGGHGSERARSAAPRQARTYYVADITGQAIMHVLYEQLMKHAELISPLRGVLHDRASCSTTTAAARGASCATSPTARWSCSRPRT